MTRSCVQCGLYIIAETDGAAALLVRGPEEHGAIRGRDRGGRLRPRWTRAGGVDEIRQLGLERNVFRGHVISFGDEVFSHHRGALLSFVDRPQVASDEVILPPEILGGIERQVLGVARHAPRLLASGQHLRRGVLLYGVPVLARPIRCGTCLACCPASRPCCCPGGRWA